MQPSKSYNILQINIQHNMQREDKNLSKGEGLGEWSFLSSFASVIYLGIK